MRSGQKQKKAVALAPPEGALFLSPALPSLSFSFLTSSPLSGSLQPTTSKCRKRKKNRIEIIRTSAPRPAGEASAPQEQEKEPPPTPPSSPPSPRATRLRAAPPSRAPASPPSPSRTPAPGPGPGPPRRPPRGPTPLPGPRRPVLPREPCSASKPRKKRKGRPRACGRRPPRARQREKKRKRNSKLSESASASAETKPSEILASRARTSLFSATLLGKALVASPPEDTARGCRRRRLGKAQRREEQHRASSCRRRIADAKALRDAPRELRRDGRGEGVAHGNLDDDQGSDRSGAALFRKVDDDDGRRGRRRRGRGRGSGGLGGREGARRKGVRCLQRLQLDRLHGPVEPLRAGSGGCVFDERQEGTGPGSWLSFEFGRGRRSSR